MKKDFWTSMEQSTFESGYFVFYTGSGNTATVKQLNEMKTTEITVGTTEDTTNKKYNNI